MNYLKGHRTLTRLVELGILLVLPIIAHLFLPIMFLILSPYRYFGILLMVLGLIMAIAASKVFRAAGTSFKLHGDASHLVTEGPFRMTRNPMYLGMLMWFVGVSVLLGTLSPFLFVALLFVLINYVIIPMEERSLREIHGQKYTDYRRRVRRWLNVSAQQGAPADG